MKRIVAVMLLLSSAVAGAQERERLPVEQLRKFAEVYGAIRTNYIEATDHEVLVRHAIEGLLKIDPQGQFLDAEEFSALQRGPEPGVGGLGVEITMRRGTVRLVSPMDDSPASRAGLKPNDALLKIDDVDLQDKGLPEAVKLLRGKPGTQVRLSVQSPGEAQREVALVREIIRVRSVRSALPRRDVGYLRVAQFQERTPELMAKELAALWGSGELRLLILDLRANPGGLLFASVAGAALFLPDDAVISRTVGRAEDAKREFRAVPQDYLRRGQADPRTLLPPQARSVPLAVLVDGGTAAGSEIVAAALREHKRAVLVGTQTFGRGTVQTIMPLGNNTAIKLTTARYVSPSGAPIEGVGLRPDVEVTAPVARAEFGSEADPALRAAIDRLLR
jgi:carboxyl-terminal processing protease